MDKYEKDITELGKSQKAYQELQHYRKNSSIERDNKVELTKVLEKKYPFQNRVDMAKSLFGILPADITLEEVREERLSKLAEVTAKLETFSQNDYDMVEMLVDRLAEEPSGILKATRDKYVQKNPLSMEEIDEEIQAYRKGSV